MSSGTILIYDSKKSTVLSWTSCGSGNNDLLDLLFEYCKILGVTSYVAEDDNIKWLLHNNWYSSDEIERMIKIKVFI
jgi:hypothetical protein